MAKFCKKCGAMLDGASGKCPVCDKNKVVKKTREIKDDLSNAVEQQEQLSKKKMKSEKKKLKKQAKKDKKAQKKAQMTKKQKVQRFFLKFFVVILALMIAVSGFWFALVYFDVVDISTQQSYNLLENAPDDLMLTDMTEEKTNEEYGAIFYTPVDEKHIAGDDYIKYSDNEILIVVKEGTTREQIDLLAIEYDADIVGEIQISGDYQLKFNNSYKKDELKNIISKIENEEIVESASLNYILSISDSAQEEQHAGFFFGEKWQGDLQNSNNAKGKSWGLEAIETLAAWDWLGSHSESVKPVRLGLIDTGFDVSHEDLKFAEVFYDNGANGITSKRTDHGTHVAGTMTADNSSTIGICGVYPYGNGRLYGVTDVEDAYSENASVMGQKIAYSELIVRNVKVINYSMGFNWYKHEPFAKYNKKGEITSIDYDRFNKWYTTYDFSELKNMAKDLGDFLNRMIKKGYDFVIVSAAGNDSDSSIGHIDCTYTSWNSMISKEDYPDVFDRIIVVGAVDYKLNIAEYSNGGDRVDIYAPGGGRGIGNKKIYSTLPHNKYGTDLGTSMAAPHVSGVAAMVWSINNSLTGAQVKEIIRSSNSERCTSCNMIDAYKAVQRASDTTGNGTASYTENGGVICYVVDQENVDTKIGGATIVATNTETQQTYNAVTDSSGHFELLVPQGEYTLTVKAKGYSDYIWKNNVSQSITIQSGEINYLDDWIKMTSLKQALFKNLSSKTDKPILQFYYDDYDSDGKFEAFAVVGDADASMGDNWYFNAEVWFVSEQKIERIKSDIYGFPNGILKGDKHSFLSLEKSAGGSGSTSYIFGVKDGFPQEMNVSEKYGDFSVDENYIFKGCVNDFSSGYHQWIYTEFLFDSVLFEFIENTPENAEYIKNRDTVSTSAERDIVLVLDVSGSMDGTPLDETKKASQKFINTILKQDASIGIVAYDNQANMMSNFNMNENYLTNTVSALDSGGGTNIESGLVSAQEMLKSSNAKKKIIVLMSDGEPNGGKVGDDLIEYAQTIKNEGVYIYTLGFFEDLGSSKSSAQILMEKIASEGCHYEVANADDLVFFFGDIADQLNGQKYVYIRIACPTDVIVEYGGESLCSSDKNFNDRTSFGAMTLEDVEDSDEKIKTLRLKDGVNYDIKIEGTGRGRMDYTIGYMDDSGEYTDFRKFKNIPITKKTVIDTKSEFSNKTVLKIDEDGDGRYDSKYQASENGTGELVDYTYIIYIALGVIGVIAVLTVVLILRRKFKKRKVAQ